MMLVGLTGGIATGKSTVSKILADNGCIIIDADLIARQVVEPGTTGLKRIRQAFGDDICLPDGRLDRDRLGSIIFADSDKRRLLNSILHPLIRRRLLQEVCLGFLKGHRYLILDVPLLLENRPLRSLLSEIVVVYCDEETQLRRLMSRNNYTQEAALQRISSQMSIETKRSMASRPLCLIDNNSDVSATRQQVLQLKHYLDNSWKPAIIRLVLIGLLVAIPVSASLLVNFAVFT